MDVNGCNMQYRSYKSQNAVSIFYVPTGCPHGANDAVFGSSSTRDPLVDWGQAQAAHMQVCFCEAGAQAWNPKAMDDLLYS